MELLLVAVMGITSLAEGIQLLSMKEQHTYPNAIDSFPRIYIYLEAATYPPPFTKGAEKCYR